MTPDLVTVPPLPTTDLGVHSGQPQDYIFAGLKDDEVSEILINDPETMFVMKKGRRLRVPAFTNVDIESYHKMLNNFILPLSVQPVRPISRNYIVEFQLQYSIPHDPVPVFARFHATTPPTSLCAVVTIAKMPRSLITLEQLCTQGTANPQEIQFLIDAISCGCNCIIAGNTGAGKMLPENTPILSTVNHVTRYRQLKDIHEGNAIYDMDGRATTVTGRVDNGEQPVWLLHLSNGKTIPAGQEHQWLVSRGEGKDFTVRTTENVAGWFIPPARPIEFPHMRNHLSPYLVGMWLSTRSAIMGENLPDYAKITKVPESIEFGSIRERKELIEGLKLGDFAPETLKRVKSTLGKNTWVQVLSVEKTEKTAHMFCLEVDSPTHTYLFGYDNMVTHNTTMLRALLPYIYTDSDRVGVVEDARELFVPREDVVYETTTPKRPDDHERVTMDFIIQQLMRMRVTSILVGEVRDSAAQSFIRACNSGTNKSLLTIHAISAADALEALVNYCMSGETTLSEQSLRRQVAKAVNLVVFLDRDSTGHRRVRQITEVSQTVGGNGVFQTSDIFVFDEQSKQFLFKSRPSDSLLRLLAQNGCNQTLSLFGIKDPQTLLTTR